MIKVEEIKRREIKNYIIIHDISFEKQNSDLNAGLFFFFKGGKEGDIYLMLKPHV